MTIKSYGDGVRAYLSWCAANGKPAVLDRRQLREFIDGLLTAGAKPATATARHLAVRRFSAWLTEEGEQDSDPLLGLALTQTGQAGHRAADRRPAARHAARRAAAQTCGTNATKRLLRLMFTTGARAGEVVAMEVGDLNLRSNPPTAIIRRGKGGKGRNRPAGCGGCCIN